jgi:hypothetical protein
MSGSDPGLRPWVFFARCRERRLDLCRAFSAQVLFLVLDPGLRPRLVCVVPLALGVWVVQGVCR